MSFVDRAVITVTAGAGGAGASSFARFKYVPKGGPDGGDGGRGGSVYLRGDPNLATLLDYTYHRTWKADRGQHGKGKNMTGASAADIILPVPLGTVVRDLATGEVVGELLEPGQTLLAGRGGRGGRGNARFATATHQAPREWEPGGDGETRQLELELKLIADVGLVGAPNAGKSTLLSVISAARPKIADYPFTTLEPVLGTVGLGRGRSFVVADVPGLIEGAHLGRGLGHRFLRHVERTRILAFLVSLEEPSVQEAYDHLRDEIRRYSAALDQRPHLVVLTKRDLLPAEARLPALAAPEAAAVVGISSVAGAGVDALIRRLWRMVRLERPAAARAGEEDHDGGG